jgi:hypothetical protein
MIDPEAALLMADSRFALGREYSAPLGDATSGRLEIVQGAVQLTVSGDAPSDLLFSARFGSAMAEVQTEGHIVRVIYHKHSGMKRKPEYNGRLALNAAIPWAVAFHWGVVRLQADLQALTLTSLSIDGGVSQITVSLPPPSDVVPVTITGGMHQVVLKRPMGAPLRLTLRGGAANVALDHQRIHTVAGELVLVSTGFDEGTPRFEVLVSGGASGLKIV